MMAKRKKKSNFVAENVILHLFEVFLQLLSIPFRIVCSGAYQSPLQARTDSNTRARLDGITTANVARTLFQTLIKRINFLIIYSYSSIKSSLFVC